MLLGFAGLLDGLHATTHWRSLDWMRAEEARAEAAEVLRISPDFSLEFVRQRFPYKDPAASERLVADLRKAGLK